VTRLEIREQRSRTRVSALLGAALGLGGGALLGRSFYDPESKTHYQPGVYTAVGAVLGAAAGAMLGALVGSFVDYESWVEGELAADAARPDVGSAQPSVPGSCPAAAPTAW
jgi:hypothetical protein